MSKILGLNKDSLLRYYRNCTSKKCSLKVDAVTKIESGIIRHIAIVTSSSLALQPLEAAIKPQESSLVSPIHFKSELSGWAVAVYALGDQMLSEGWHFKSQRNEQSVPLRKGFRARKLFQQQASSKLSGRCFEWHITEHKSPFGAGLPKFVMRELLPDATTGVLMRGEAKWAGSSPQEMCCNMYKDPNGGDNCHGTSNGVRLCGFDNPGVWQLLEAAEDCDSTKATHDQRTFGVFTAISDYSKSSLAALVAHASSSFNAAMIAVCPTDHVAAFTPLRNSQRFQQDWEYEPDDPILQSPLCQGMVDAYKNAPSREARTAILSLWAPYYPYKLTESLFSVDHNDVYNARLQHANGHAGRQLDKLKHHRFRMDAQKFSFIHQWLRSDYASKDGDAGSEDRQRQDIRARLYPVYQKHARLEGIIPASQVYFYDAMGDGFCDQTSENCCCMQCIEGWNHLALMKDFINDSSNGLSDPRKKAHQVDEIRKFLDYDFRWKHLEDSSDVVTHCMNHALASPDGCFSNQCSHCHVNRCVECNAWAVLMDTVRQELRTHFDEQTGVVLLTTERPGDGAAMLQDSTRAATERPGDGAAAQHSEMRQHLEGLQVELERREQHLSQLDAEYHRYIAYIVGKHRSSRA